MKEEGLKGEEIPISDTQRPADIITSWNNASYWKFAFVLKSGFKKRLSLKLNERRSPNREFFQSVAEPDPQMNQLITSLEGIILQKEKRTSIKKERVGEDELDLMFAELTKELEDQGIQTTKAWL